MSATHRDFDISSLSAPFPALTLLYREKGLDIDMYGDCHAHPKSGRLILKQRVSLSTLMNKDQTRTAKIQHQNHLTSRQHH